MQSFSGKRVIVVALFLVGLSALVFAGGQNESNSEATDDVTVIRVWANDAHNRPEYQETVDRFNNTVGKEMGVRIDHKVYGGDYYSTIDIAIAAGEEPHIFKSRKSGQYAQEGQILPIASLPGGQKLIDETEGLHMPDVGVFGGKVYAIPIRVTTQNLIYNVDLFNELGLDVPVSWDELRETARVITEKSPGNVYGFALPLKYANYKYYFVGYPAAPSIGHQFFNHKTGRFDFKSLAPYFELMLGIIDDGSMFPGIEGLDFDTMRAQFSVGNIGMTIGHSFDVGVLYDQFPAEIEWGVAPIPVMDPENRYKQVGNPGAFYVISSRVREEGVEEEAMAVYNAFLSTEHLALTYERGKDIPIRGEAIIKNAGEPTRPQWIEFADLSNVYVKPAYPESKINVEGDSYGDIFSRILTGRVEVAPALAELDRRYNAALDAAIASGNLDISQYIDPNYDERVRYND